jgi:hypothetical protein
MDVDGLGGCNVHGARGVRSALRAGARLTLLTLLPVGLVGIDGIRAAGGAPASTCRRSAQGPTGTLPDASSWQAIPPGPADGRTATSVVWTGNEIVVWGGEAGNEAARYADGAAYNPSRGTWRVLPAAPLTPRSDHAAVWTGEEMIVWGGVGVQRDPTPDAATYDPERDQWRRIADAPIPSASRAVAVWTGEEMIVWGGSTQKDGAAFDPARNKWRRIPRSPLSARAGAAATWTGCEVVIWGGQSIGEWGFLDDGASYNPATRRWRKLPPAPLGTERIRNVDKVPGLPPVITARGFIHPNAVWSGEEVLVWGNLHRFRAGAPRATPLAGYNPKARTWRALASPTIDFARQSEGTGGERTAWAGDSMVALTGNVDVRGVRALRYEPSRDLWDELPSPTAQSGFVPDYNAELVFTGISVIAWQATTSFVLG